MQLCVRNPLVGHLMGGAGAKPGVVDANNPIASRVLGLIEGVIRGPEQGPRVKRRTAPDILACACGYAKAIRRR